MFGLAINQKTSSAKQLPSHIWNGLFEPKDSRSLERRGPGRGCLNKTLGTAKLDLTLSPFSLSEARRCFHLEDVVSTESTMAESPRVCYMESLLMAPVLLKGPFCTLGMSECQRHESINVGSCVSKWRKAVKAGTQWRHQKRNQERQVMRGRGHQKTASAPQQREVLLNSHNCHRVCRLRIGPHSHSMRCSSTQFHGFSRKNDATFYFYNLTSNRSL